MTDMTAYWDALSPYASFIESLIGVNATNLSPLIPIMESPVLVVGAGQGLLVEELLRQGFRTIGVDFSPQMVAYAENRRGIKLICANAENMPFHDGRFKTTIVATGVIDFLDNSGQIGTIIGEARRVTESRGKTFVASMGMTPQNRELVRYLDLLSDDNRVKLKEVGQMLLSRKSFIREALAVVRSDPNKNMIRFVTCSIRSYLSTFKWNNAQYRAANEVKKKIKSGELPDPKDLLDRLPAYMFFRSREQILALFQRLNFPPSDFLVFDNCIITQLG